MSHYKGKKPEIKHTVFTQDGRSKDNRRTKRRKKNDPVPEAKGPVQKTDPWKKK
jgi:hypothetical protein